MATTRGGRPRHGPAEIPGRCARRRRAGSGASPGAMDFGMVQTHSDTADGNGTDRSRQQPCGLQSARGLVTDARGKPRLLRLFTAMSKSSHLCGGSAEPIEATPVKERNNHGGKTLLPTWHARGCSLSLPGTSTAEKRGRGGKERTSIWGPSSWLAGKAATFKQ